MLGRRAPGHWRGGPHRLLRRQQQHYPDGAENGHHVRQEDRQERQQAATECHHMWVWPELEVNKTFYKIKRPNVNSIVFISRCRWSSQ